MATSLGAHSPQIALVRELLSKKGRRDQGRFTLEGPTLLAEALRSHARIEAVYATPGAYGRFAQVREAESAGASIFLVEDRTLARLSDLKTPPGIVSVTPIALEPPRDLLAEPGLVLLLAGIGDPGNAGTLLRSAEAFGIGRVIFGSPAVEPHNPKVVRSAMGSMLRLRLAIATPAALGPCPGWQITGLDMQGEPLAGLQWGARELLAVGAERRGLGDWGALCTRKGAILMAGDSESLNAAVAGSIALYEATRPGT